MASQIYRTRISTRDSLPHSRTRLMLVYRSESGHKSMNSASHQARPHTGENLMRARLTLNRIALHRSKPRLSTRITEAKSSIIASHTCSKRLTCFLRTIQLLHKSLERTNCSHRSPRMSKTSAVASFLVKQKPRITDRWHLEMVSHQR